MDDAQLIAEAEMSPCVGVCKMDVPSGWCYGCGRTDSEIAGWQSYQNSFKKELIAPLADRVSTLITQRRAARNSERTVGRRVSRRSKVA